MNNYPMRETRAIIDLNALNHNLTILANRVPGSKLAPAVKSDGYGHGAEAVAHTSQEWGAAMLLTATVEEFLVLKHSGITLSVLILEDLFQDEMEVAIQEGAFLSVGGLDYAEKISRTAVKLGRTVKIHINLDTGMGRMGLFSNDLAGDVQKITALDGIELDGIFSHFPISDESDKSFSYRQIEHILQVFADLENRGIRPRLRHIANSGAIIDFPEKINWDIVRPGISIYGMYPSRDVDRTIGLKPVMRLVSRLVKITRYDRDWTIGYGRSYPVRDGALIGIIPIGYGDGYPRLLSNRGEVLVKGRRLPLAGRVSMDMIAVDLTRLPQDPTVGEEVVLIGKQDNEEITVAELAELTGTITYEITCDITTRVPRLYMLGGKAVAKKTLLEGYGSLC